MNTIIETLKEADNEGTDSPWWMVIDIKGIKDIAEGCCEHQEIPSDDYILSNIAMNIEGPFFSREDAEEYLKNRRYAYSELAKVWCASGYRSAKYKNFYRRLNAQEGK